MTPEDKEKLSRAFKSMKRGIIADQHNHSTDKSAGMLAGVDVAVAVLTDSETLEQFGAAMNGWFSYVENARRSHPDSTAMNDYLTGKEIGLRDAMAKAAELLSGQLTIL